MPVTSKSQARYIYYLRDKYKNKSSTPEKYQWIWNEDWFKGVDFNRLPDKAENEGKTIEELEEQIQESLLGNKIYLFDFDDTIVVTPAKIIIYLDDNNSIELTTKEFAILKNKYKDFKMDFSQFQDYEILKKAKALKWVLDIIDKIYKKNIPIGVITARSDKNMVVKFLRENLKLPISSNFVYAVTDKSWAEQFNTKDVAELKKIAIEELISTYGYDTIIYFDDDIDNLISAKKLEAELGVKVVTKHIKDKWLPKL